MNIIKTFEVSRGTMELGFVALRGDIHIKVLKAVLKNAPATKNTIEDVALWHDKDYRWPTSCQQLTYFDDFALLLRDVLAVIDWKQIQVLLYDVNRESLKRDLALKTKQRIALENEEITLAAALEEAEADSKQGLFQKAINIVQSVIFRLT